MPKKSAPATPPSGSTHDIWLAGLGAMAQAQARGSQAFESLVQEGLAFQRQSQAQAQQRFEEATARLSQLTQSLGEQASGRMDKLEQVFEERVARALHRLGMPTLQDLAQLQMRVQDLEQQVARLGGRAAQAPAKATARTKAPRAPKA